MKIIKVLLVLLLLQGAFAEFDLAPEANYVYNKITLEKKSSGYDMRVEYSFNQDDQYFYKNDYLYGYSKKNVFQKQILTGGEKDFYKLDFQEGAYLITKGDKAFGADTKSLNETIKNDAGGLWFTGNQAQIRKNYNLRDKIVHLSITESLPVQSITGIVMIYATTDSSAQLTDINGVLLNSANKDKNKADHCDVVYYPVSAVKKISSNKWVVELDQKNMRSCDLGDGIVFTLVIPFVNSNSQKSYISLYKRVSKI